MEIPWKYFFRTVRRSGYQVRTLIHVWADTDRFRAFVDKAHAVNGTDIQTKERGIYENAMRESPELKDFPDMAGGVGSGCPQGSPEGGGCPRPAGSRSPAQWRAPV